MLALGRRKFVEHAAIDLTGFECSAAGNYFVKLLDRLEHFWKMETCNHYSMICFSGQWHKRVVWLSGALGGV
jgi:hypothetical protein